MRRKHTAFDHLDLPKVPMKLKDVPVENHLGEKLERCLPCDGSGQVGMAKRKEFSAASGKFEVVEEKRVHGNNAPKGKGYFGWEVNLGECAACKGAGVVKSGVHHAR